MQVTHWKKLTNPNHLGSWDIEPGGQLQVEIESVRKDMVMNASGTEEECVVAEIKDMKPLILNKTNCKTITQVLETPYIEEWSGQRIILVTQKVKAFGGVHDAIRVKNTKDQREVLSPTSKRWDGAIEALKNGKVDSNYIKKTFNISTKDLEQLERESNA